MFRIIPVLWLSFISFAQAEDFTSPKPLTAGMIETMVHDKAWAQLVLRLQEVSPPQRNAAWHKALETAAVAYLNQVAELKTGKLDKMCEEVVARYPSLEESAAFRRARQHAVLITLDECFAKKKSKVNCAELAYNIALRTPEDTALIGAIASTVSKNASPAEAAKIFLINTRHSTQLCREPKFVQSLLAAMSRGEADYDWGSELKVSRCRGELGGPLAAALAKAHPTDGNKICRALAAVDPHRAKASGCASIKKAP